MRFIGDDEDVLPRPQLGQCLNLFRHKLVDGREHHAAAHLVQKLGLMLAPGGLIRRLAGDVRATLELTPNRDALSVDVLSTIHGTVWLPPTNN